MKQLCNLLILKAWEIMCNKKIHPSIRKRERIKENKREATTNNKEKKALHCTHCEADGHDEENCWRLHPELRLKKFGGKGKKKTIATVHEDLGSNSSDETKIATIGFQGKISLHTGSRSKNVSQDKDKIRS